MCRSMLSPCENWKLEYSYYYCARGHTAFAILIYSTDISKNKGTGRLVYDCSSFFIGLKSVVESSIFCLDSGVREENCILCDVDPNLCPSLESDYEDVWPQPSQPALARWEGEIKLGTIYVGTRRRFTFQLCRRVKDWEENISPNLKFNCNNKSHNSVSVCHCIMHAWSPYPYPYFVKSVLCLWKSRNVPIVVWQ